MELRDYIETASKKAGSTAELARIIGLTREATSAAKGHKRPLPAIALAKLSIYLQIELEKLTAANELVTEKDEERRQFWEHLLSRGIAASIALVFGLVTNFVTPSPAAASNDANAPISQFALCKLSLL